MVGVALGARVAGSLVGAASLVGSGVGCSTGGSTRLAAVGVGVSIGAIIVWRT